MQIIEFKENPVKALAVFAKHSVFESHFHVTYTGFLYWVHIIGSPTLMDTYEGSSISFLFRYEGVKLEIWNIAHILLDMYRGAMQEFVFLRYVLDLQMTFGIVGGEAIVLREREFPIFRNHVLWFPERWHHRNVYSHYAYNQSHKSTLLVNWRSDKGHNFYNR